MTLRGVALASLGNVGRLAQLVRALPSHGRGQRFKSFVAHHLWLHPANFILTKNREVNRLARRLFLYGSVVCPIDDCRRRTLPPKYYRLVTSVRRCWTFGESSSPLSGGEKWLRQRR